MGQTKAPHRDLTFTCPRRHTIHDSHEGRIMLILTRKENEAFLIGGNIRVVVTKVRRVGQVKLGIEAPEDVKVVREELIETEHLPSTGTPSGRAKST